MNWNQKPVLRRQKWVPKIEKKIYVSHTTYLQKRVQLKCISHKSNASRKMSTNFSFTFKTPDTLLSHYKKTCLATVELLYWIRLCLIIRLISIKWYIVWNRKIIFALNIVLLYFVINIFKSVQIEYKISFELLYLIVFALDILIHDSFARSLYTITDWGSLEITR